MPRDKKKQQTVIKKLTNTLLPEQDVREIVEEVSGIPYSVIISPVDKDELSYTEYYARLCYLVLIRRYCGINQEESGKLIGRSHEYVGYHLKRYKSLINIAHNYYSDEMREMYDECEIRVRIRRGRYRDIEIVAGMREKVSEKRTVHAQRRDKQDPTIPDNTAAIKRKTLQDQNEE